VIEHELSNRVIGAAIEVHRILGPGLLESAFRAALKHELGLRGLRVESECGVAVAYKELEVPAAFRLDLLVEGKLIVELKAVEALRSAHKAQLLTYLRFCKVRLGLLFNFNEAMLKRGIVRVVNGI
jgi:GxxExxY protein